MPKQKPLLGPPAPIHIKVNGEYFTETFCGKEYREWNPEHPPVKLLTDLSSEELKGYHSEYCQTCLSLARMTLRPTLRGELDKLFEGNFKLYIEVMEGLQDMSSYGLWLDGLQPGEFFEVARRFASNCIRRGIRYEDMRLAIVVDRGNAVASDAGALVKLWEKEVDDYFTRNEIERYKRTPIDIRRVQGAYKALEKEYNELHDAFDVFSETSQYLMNKAKPELKRLKEIFPGVEMHRLVHLLLKHTSWPHFTLDEKPEDVFEREIDAFQVLARTNRQMVKKGLAAKRTREIWTAPEGVTHRIVGELPDGSPQLVVWQ